jgi:hypothetical protein
MGSPVIGSSDCNVANRPGLRRDVAAPCNDNAERGPWLPPGPPLLSLLVDLETARDASGAAKAVLGLARASERLGAAALWLQGSPTSRPQHIVPLAAAALAATRHIDIRLVAPEPWDMLTPEHLTMLAQESGGRIQLVTRQNAEALAPPPPCRAWAYCGGAPQNARAAGRRGLDLVLEAGNASAHWVAARVASYRAGRQSGRIAGRGSVGAVITAPAERGPDPARARRHLAWLGELGLAGVTEVICRLSIAQVAATQTSAQALLAPRPTPSHCA